MERSSDVNLVLPGQAMFNRIMWKQREARMYHYDPQVALEELQEEGMLPNPAHVRDMIIRAALKPHQALNLNRQLQTYMRAFGEAQEAAMLILHELATPAS
jgi:hypothetical protein